MVATWILGTTGCALAGFLIGRCTVLDKWRELETDKRIAAGYGNKKARAWLDRQSRKPSAEAHIVHLHALAAFTADAARTAWRRLGDPGPVWFTPQEWAAAMRSTGDNILRLPELTTDLLPRNAFLVRRLP